MTLQHSDEGSSALSNLESIGRRLKDGDYTLEEIGTSWDEINRLKRVPALLCAVEWYDFLSKAFQGGRYEDCQECIKHMRRDLKRGGATLADIGLSEKELIRYTSVPQI